MPSQLTLDIRPRRHSRFDTYIPGPNLSVVTLLDKLCEGEERVGYLWGAREAGKTHLLQACCQRLSALGKQAAYLPLADLAEFPPEILQGYESYDFLAVDDCQAIQGNWPWEEALFHLYNQVTESGSFLVAGPAPPMQLELALPDLRTRLGAGWVLQLKPLGEQEQLHLLQSLARFKGMILDQAGADFLLKRVPRQNSKLVHLVEQLDRLSLEAGRKLTIPFLKSALEKLGHGD